MPPICSLAMKTLGTERWFVICWRASWIAAPSSVESHTESALRFYNEYLVKRWRKRKMRCPLTNLIKLDGVVLRADAAQQLLGGLAVRAVGLGEDG